MHSSRHNTSHSDCQTAPHTFAMSVGHAARTRTHKELLIPRRKQPRTRLETQREEAAKRHAAVSRSRSEKEDKGYPERIASARPLLPINGGPR